MKVLHNGVDITHLSGVPSSEPALPGKLAMARNAIRSAVTAAKNPKRVSDEEQARRLSICKACEFLIRNDDGAPHRCAKCGCFLNFKSRLEAWHCPIKKW